MKKLYFVLLILITVMGADALIGAVTGNLIKNVPDVGLNQTNTAQALFNRTSEILILGSSRANHSFDSRIIAKLTGLSCYNAGRDGMGIAYDECVIRAYLERCTPKVIILDLTNSMMDGSWNGTLKDMNCYYGLSDAVDKVVGSWASPVRRIQLKSNLFRYNKTFEWLIGAYISPDQSSLNGYRPMPVNESAQMHVRFNTTNEFRVDAHDKMTLDTIVRLCKEKHIDLILTNTPSLVVSKKDEFAEWINTYARTCHLPIYDFSHDSSFYLHEDYFYDYSHLNERGANVFSKQIGSILRHVLLVRQ